ncbi:citrate synthase, partial [Quaeritorhiza haematococci]
MDKSSDIDTRQLWGSSGLEVLHTERTGCSPTNLRYFELACCPKRRPEAKLSPLGDLIIVGEADGGGGGGGRARPIGQRPIARSARIEPPLFNRFAVIINSVAVDHVYDMSFDRFAVIMKQLRCWIMSLTCSYNRFALEKTSGLLHTFLVEPFVPHPADTEYYICITSNRDGDLILFTHEGGVDVGDVDAKARKVLVPVAHPFVSEDIIKTQLLQDIPDAKKPQLVDFITKLYAVYTDLQFTYLEINPLVVLPETNEIFYLDLAAKLDQTAEFECGKKWAIARAGAYPVLSSTPTWGPPMDFPAPFGRELTKEEAYIAELDAKTGASLKLTVLNPQGRIWTMVAGGGASVVYTDAIAAHGFAHEIANYGEYSGAPSESQTYEYAKTLLDLMTRGQVHPEGKILFIGGGIANFTNVAATFKGIIRALRDFQRPILEHKVKIYVRRAGPNYQEGLRLIRQVGETLGLDMHVFGPEMFVTGIVPLALKGDTKGVKALNKTSAKGEEDVHPLMSMAAGQTPGAAVNGSNGAADVDAMDTDDPDFKVSFPTTPSTTASSFVPPFSSTTRAFIYGMQPRAIQGMLDFDFLCKRSTPSVACMIYPFGGHHVQKFYWGTKETLLPVYTSLDEAVEKFPEVDVVVNFASCRSVWESTMGMLEYAPNSPKVKALQARGVSVKGIRTVSIIAEGVPEKRAREIAAEAKKRGVLIIGPATVGGIKPGCFKIGNTGGMMDNIVSSKLYRPGSIAYVSKSGGMSNELNNIISRSTDGVYEGVAIGGD